MGHLALVSTGAAVFIVKKALVVRRIALVRARTTLLGSVGLDPGQVENVAVAGRRGIDGQASAGPLDVNQEGEASAGPARNRGRGPVR